MTPAEPAAGPAAGVTEPLSRSLRRLAAELQAESPPPLRARAVAAGVRSMPAPLPVISRWRRASVLPAPARLAWAGAVACLLVLIGSAWLMGAHRGGGAETRELARASGFLPVAPFEQWTPVGGSDAAWLVATEMPNERLAALGLPYDPARAGETVRAELLMRASGEVLAVRVVR